MNNHAKSKLSQLDPCTCRFCNQRYYSSSFIYPIPLFILFQTTPAKTHTSQRTPASTPFILPLHTYHRQPHEPSSLRQISPSSLPFHSELSILWAAYA